MSFPDRGLVRRFASLGIVACLAVSVAGCRLSYPAPPTQILHPKFVGVIDTVTITTDVQTKLTDGRMADQPLDTAYTLLPVIGDPSWGQRGWLLLADPGPGGFEKALPLWDTTSWEAWESDEANPLAWDMGDSILFVDGVELKKAAGFYAEQAPQTIDGRSAWAPAASSDTVIAIANNEGQITRMDVRG
jgi:hypothetical protein